ncbi:MAG: DUF5723 family protein [Dysgonamonadaceae bacterium]|jgi:hypothetical protein|nr:DUF5723 family protein [Dysgonamonadaceae bacterium]
MKKITIGMTGVLFLCCGMTFSVSAQYLRSSFLLSDHHYRMKLNPALLPGNGFFDIPVVGNFNFGVSSNALGSQDIIDAFSGEDGDFTSDVLYDRLAESNRMNLSFNTDAISTGWWKGDNFWSMNIGLRFDVGACEPKSMFTFMRDVKNNSNEDWENYSKTIENESLNLNAYTEIGLGYGRTVNEKLTVGARLKALLGMGNLNLEVDRIQIETQRFTNSINDPESWENGGTAKINIKAKLESSLSGMNLTKDEEGVIDGFEYKGFGIAGYGGAIDLGASYRVLNNLTLSAAVTDLGFISWSKNGTNIISSETERYYTKENYQEFLDAIEGSELINYDLFGFQHEDQTKSRTTSLYSTIAVGAEYSFVNDIFAVGLLSTTWMLKPETLTELTINGAIRPVSWFNMALSYSLIQNGGSTFGAAVKLGPLFAGTDYMYLGENTKAANVFVGITVPLGKKKKG